MGTAGTDLYECDGCGLVGSLEEVNLHIVEVTPPSIEQVKCWGAMLVGGKAWEQYHFEGRHPMTSFAELVTKSYTDAVLKANGIETD